MPNVLHITLEYNCGVGGIKTVVNGLLPALQKKGINIFVATPYYDFFKDLFNQTHVEAKPVTTITHTYKKILHTSIVYQVNSSVDNNQTYVTHYLIKPIHNSPIEKIFDVGEPQNIYQAFDYSEPQNRIEYFNSAIATAINNHSLDSFDIIHTHAWHTALSACLIKEFKQNTWTYSIPPKIISTIHMLSNDQGKLISKKHIADTLSSVGLPLNQKFLDPNYNLNQMYLMLQYSDQVVMVSNGLVRDALSNKSYGLDTIFKKLKREDRLHGITNGNTIRNWDATLPENLENYAFKSSIVEGKLKIKEFLACKYPKLNNKFNNIWYLYVGRFGEEKGIDMLPHALETINKHNGNLIIMGTQVSKIPNQYVNDLKQKDNVIVIDTMQEQLKIGKYFRAACEFTIIPSHVEACGLVTMEAMESCSIPIVSNVQGLPDTVISLINNMDTGTGFIYEDDTAHNIDNLKNIIDIAYNYYVAWRCENKLNKLFFRLTKHAYSYDWNNAPSNNYLNLYQQTIKQGSATSPHIHTAQPTINVLHVALEYAEATLGGLGVVTTQMLDAQNKFRLNDNPEAIFNASIITPYYSIFNHLPVKHITNIKHIYNHKEVESSIFLVVGNHNKHYLVKPFLSNLFKINTVSDIYANSYNSTFIERLKYFNSAVASFVNCRQDCTNHPDPSLLQLHGWHTSLVAKLLTDYYANTSIKTIFTVHINNNDRGTFNGAALAGIGLSFSKQDYILKQIGVSYADQVITVSPELLTECSSIDPKDPKEIIILKKAFLRAKLTNKLIGILNGIDYKKYGYIDKLIGNTTNIVSSKNVIKEQLATILSKDLLWKINPKLPVILYVGRFSPEKGIDTFASIINSIQDRAVFFAIGKGVNEDVLHLIMNNSRQKDNIFITFSAKEQVEYGELMRACADFVFVPSHIEACGLTPMEGFANGSLCITSGAGGLKNSVVPLICNNNVYTGNGFIYEDNNYEVNNNASLPNTVNTALNIWNSLTDLQKNAIHTRIMKEGEQFDWLANNGSTHKYLDTFNNVLLFQDRKPLSKLSVIAKQEAAKQLHTPLTKRYRIT
ncbi:MAG: glycogen/starch synthase [Gammaproteobacteria bacterium]